jgi:hypothetical protein
MCSMACYRDSFTFFLPLIYSLILESHLAKILHIFFITTVQATCQAHSIILHFAMYVHASSQFLLHTFPDFPLTKPGLRHLIAVLY